MKDKLLTTIQLYFNFENQEIRRKFGDTIDTLTKKIKPMGIFELDKMIAVEQAKEETRKETREVASLVFVQNLLQKTSLTIKEIADVAGVPLRFVKSTKAQLAN